MRTTAQLVGVITLSKLGLRQFDDEDLRLLMILADQAGDGVQRRREPRRDAAARRRAAPAPGHEQRAVALARPARRRGPDGRAPRPGRRRRPAQISDWDRANGRLRTLGCFPTAAARTMDDYYPSRATRSPRASSRSGVIESVDTEDPAADPAEAELLRHDGMRGLVMLPLVAKGAGDRPRRAHLRRAARPPTPARSRSRRTMTHEAAMALENARLYEDARNLADRDPLTGFFNHRYLHERLAEEVVRAVADPAPAERRDARPRRLQARQRHLRPPLRRRVLVHVAELHPLGPPRLGRPGALRRRRVRADPPRDRPRGRRRRRRADPGGVPRLAVLRRRARSRSRSAARSGSRPTRATAARPPTCSRSRTGACTTPRPPAGTASGPDPEAVVEATWTPTSRRPSARRAPPAHRRTARPAGAGWRADGGSGAVGGGLSRYGSTRTRRPTVLAGTLASAGRRPHARTQGEPPEQRHWRPRAAHGIAWT